MLKIMDLLKLKKKEFRTIHQDKSKEKNAFNIRDLK